MQFLTLFVLLLAELVAGNEVQFSDVGPWVITCHHTFLYKDINYVMALYLTVRSNCLYLCSSRPPDTEV